MKMLCVQCGVKSARRFLPGGTRFFCTLRCAWRWAMERVPDVEQWCPHCGKWSHPDDWRDPATDNDRCPVCEYGEKHAHRHT